MVFLLVISCSYSDESDDEFDCEPESSLMSKMGLTESTLYEVINDHQTQVKVGRILFLLIDRYTVLRVLFRLICLTV